MTKCICSNWQLECHFQLTLRLLQHNVIHNLVSEALHFLKENSEAHFYASQCRLSTARHQ